jgi:glucan phosphoethanolaminetransferase (alkaline phosphatase superfamily)
MGIFKDENGNSYGDWQHRGQGRTHDQANTIVGKDDQAQEGAGAPKKWYGETLWVVLFLLVIWPVGLVLMWLKTCTWPTIVKVVVTIVLVVFLVVWYNMVSATMSSLGI